MSIFQKFPISLKYLLIFRTNKDINIKIKILKVISILWGHYSVVFVLNNFYLESQGMQFYSIFLKSKE